MLGVEVNHAPARVDRFAPAGFCRYARCTENQRGSHAVLAEAGHRSPRHRRPPAVFVRAIHRLQRPRLRWGSSTRMCTPTTCLGLDRGKCFPTLAFLRIYPLDNASCHTTFASSKLVVSSFHEDATHVAYPGLEVREHLLRWSGLQVIATTNVDGAAT